MTGSKARLAVLLLPALALTGLALTAGCRDADPIEVTYYYLPG